MKRPKKKKKTSDSPGNTILRRKPRLVREASTGLIITQAPPNRAKITSQTVRAILEDFP